MARPHNNGYLVGEKYPRVWVIDPTSPHYRRQGKLLSINTEGCLVEFEFGSLGVERVSFSVNAVTDEEPEE